MRLVESSAFIFPNHKPDVTVQYAKWWEPYSSACDSAIANAAEMKDGHDFVSPPKRKMEGVLAGKSGTACGHGYPGPPTQYTIGNTSTLPSPQAAM